MSSLSSRGDLQTEPPFLLNGVFHDDYHYYWHYFNYDSAVMSELEACGVAMRGCEAAVSSLSLSRQMSLGRPLPLDEHAVSVSLPEWRDVIGYEEGHPRVVLHMRMGYPRFKVHAAVEALCDYLLACFEEQAAGMPRGVAGHTPFSWRGGMHSKDVPAGHTVLTWDTRSQRRCSVLPSKAVALRFKEFLDWRAGDSAADDNHRRGSGRDGRRSVLSLQPVGVEGLWCVVYDAGSAARAKAYWQHTGEIVSSRQVRRSTSFCISVSYCNW
jgi:cystathionine gamma-synthase